ncbi:hypothetical protein LAH08_02551 [Micromonospora noduli]|uniref:Uncharacterized protein n=1 Tax=Micromonospora noduli TaxID=709876 RepID=A0A328N9K6_9ACTN|nr:hypothetical protein LAH08_02551 [Micromonospora noduli]
MWITFRPVGRCPRTAKSAVSAAAGDEIERVRSARRRVPPPGAVTSLRRPPAGSVGTRRRWRFGSFRGPCQQTSACDSDAQMPGCSGRRRTRRSNRSTDVERVRQGGGSAWPSTPGLPIGASEPRSRFHVKPSAGQRTRSGDAGRARNGPAGERASGRAGERASGRAGERASGRAAQRRGGPAVRRPRGPAAQRRAGAGAPQRPNAVQLRGGSVIRRTPTEVAARLFRQTDHDRDAPPTCG